MYENTDQTDRIEFSITANDLPPFAQRCEEIDKTADEEYAVKLRDAAKITYKNLRRKQLDYREMHMYKHTLHIDIETRSSADIKTAGAYKYAIDDDFDILLIAYAIDDEPVRVFDPKYDYDHFTYIFLREALLDPDYLKIAYNASFEWFCFNQFGWHTPIEQWRCTMVHAAYCGYPMGLEATGKAMGLSQDKAKLSTGKALIRYFCTPQKPTKTNGGRKYNDPHHDPEKWELFKQYCARDVEAEREIQRWLDHFPMPEEEWDLWRQETLMNAKGVRVDRKLIEGALYCNDVVTEELMEEARRITGLDNPNSTAQMLDWLERMEYPLPNLQKETVAKAIAESPTPEIKRVLEIRQQLGKTSNKKYEAAAAAICRDDHVRGLMQFYGANRTGRWAGRLIQVQNLTKHYIKTVDEARNIVKAGNVEAAKMLWGNVSGLLSQLTRTMFIPSEGRKLIVADFSAIEARVIAWLAREKWVMDAFAAGKDIYCETASMMYHVPVEKNGVNSELRQKGKVATLACIAEGQLVLTDQGLIPIERVTTDMKLWDGDDWVCHDGVIYKGEKEVISYEGLTATPDHRVIVWGESKGECREVYFGDAASSGSHLVQSGAGRQAVRMASHSNPGEALHERMEPVHGSDRVCRLRSEKMDISCEHDAGKDTRLPKLQSAQGCSEVAGQEVHRGETAVREPSRSTVQELWGEGHKIRVSDSNGCVSVYDRDERSSRRPKNGDRPQRQQRQLCSGESEMVNPQRTDVKPTPLKKVPVYDIINAGPKHRYTVSDCLVHNCGYQGGVGALNAMDPGGVIPESEKQDIVERWRDANKMITSLWYETEYAVLDVVMSGIPKRIAKDRVKIALEEDGWQRFMTMKLPSGRKLFYALPTIQENRFGKPAVHYYDLNGTTKKWEETSTYGGRAVENCVQSIARDCLAVALKRIRNRGLDVVFHVHDEVVIDAPMDVTVKSVCDLMSEPIAWAPGLVLKADGFESDYYKKD